MAKSTEKVYYEVLENYKEVHPLKILNNIFKYPWSLLIFLVVMTIRIIFYVYDFFFPKIQTAVDVPLEPFKQKHSAN